MPVRPSDEVRGGHRGDPEPDPGVPDVPPSIDDPGIAVQVSTCLDAFDIFGDDKDSESGAGERARDRIVDGMRAAHPGADVRVACIDGREHIGLWRRPVEQDEHVGARHQAREEGLAAIDILEEDEMMAFRIRASFVRDLASDEWRDLPKRYNTSGRASEGGSVRLRYLRIRFVEPDRITTTIGMKWSAIKFRVRVEDTLSLGHGRHRPVLCDTQVKVRSKPFKWALAVTKAVLRVVFPRRRVDIRGQAEDEGAGCAMVDELPRQFLIPGLDTKLEVSYQRLVVGERYLDAGATLRYTGRRPEVSISGPSQVQAFTPQAMFTATTTDLRDPDLRWTADGNVSDPTSERTSVVFPSEPDRTPQVRVTASDGDGGSAHASQSVSVVGDPPGGGGGPGKGGPGKGGPGKGGPGGGVHEPGRPRVEP